MFAFIRPKPKDSILVEVKNTMHMLSVYAKEFDCHTVVFTSTPIVIEYATSLGHTIVTNTSFLILWWLSPRCNRFGLPFIQPILEVTRALYNSMNIGYINSDILFSSRLFLTLTSLQQRPIYPIVGKSI